MRILTLVASFALLPACMSAVTPAQRLSDATQEMNDAMRFGRMDVVMSRVGARARADFAKRHAAWGRSLRIVEVEPAGMELRAKDEALVLLNVSWQRLDEATVRTTLVAQRWKDDKGWQVADEEKRGGSAGLFGEPPDKAAPPVDVPVARQAQFRTRVIYESDE